MFRAIGILVLGILLSTGGKARGEAAAPATVVSPANGSLAERLAAREIRRYVYLRTGTLLPIVASEGGSDLANVAAGPLIVVGHKDRQEIKAISDAAELKTRIAALPPGGYLIQTIEQSHRPTLLIAGGDSIGALYGAYRFAEHLGVRFYLHGDVVPDKQVPFAIPPLNETRKPLFALRGIQPFHDFPEGPDWWSRDGYKAILGQLPKMGMNFFGLHTYPEHPTWTHVGPEPLVWIGPPDELAPDGRVKASYPSRHFTASNINAAWGYQPGKTGEYAFGAAEMFDRDDYGADYMRDTCPWNKMSPEQCDALFNRVGEFFGDVFGFARRLDIKTCIGTETPLIIPTQLKERLRAAGKNPADPAVVQELYEGIFQRIAKIHSLDYYWLWTPENWTWEAVKQEQIDAAMADFRAVLAAAQKVRPPFTLATCGWVLGPLQSPSLFDEFLPKEMPMSCINRQVGYAPVEPGFAKVAGRPKWAIPWLEDDPGIAMPQLWVGRMRRDAADALKYGCTGLMGIHWRTRVLAPNVSALAKASWDQTGWSGPPKPATAFELSAPVKPAADGKSPFAPAQDFYADWAAAEFGTEASEPIAAIFARLDGYLPRPSDWVTGPGGIRPDEQRWEEVQKDYSFVDELAALRPRIEGAGNLARFDYWLDTFHYLRSIAEVRCVWGRFNAAMRTASAEKDPLVQRKLARELALPIRKDLVAAFAELHCHLMATVTTSGEMGNVANWQQQTLPALLTAPGRELAKLLGEDLPANSLPGQQYVGDPRMFVPEVRTSLTAGEALKLNIIILGGMPQDAAFVWRRLGEGEYSSMRLTHVSRGVYAVTLPADAAKSDFEYYVRATVGGKPLVFPQTGPRLNQTVVVVE